MVTTDEMLEQAATLLFFNGVWHARLRGGCQQLSSLWTIIAIHAII